jgi:protein gp37
MIGSATPEGRPYDGTKRQLITIGKTRDGGKRYIYNGRVALNHKKLAAALKIPKNGGRRQRRRADGSCDHGNWEPVGNRVFWNFQSDTFHERLSFEQILQQIATMAARKDLRFFVLTKRPERALAFLQWLEHQTSRMLDVYPRDSSAWRQGSVLYRSLARAGIQLPSTIAPDALAAPWANIAIGVSAEDQKRWDERVPLLRQIPAAMRFVSVEPMLGPVIADSFAGIDQVIMGAESGYGARPCKLKWLQDLGTQVLNAQAREPDVASLFQPGGTRSNRVSGPALFFKQGDVCEVCDGSLKYAGKFDGRCYKCEVTGQPGKLRKGCPKLFIPGHGAHQWRQFPAGWAP